MEGICLQQTDQKLELKREKMILLYKLEFYKFYSQILYDKSISMGNYYINKHINRSVLTCCM